LQRVFTISVHGKPISRWTADTAVVKNSGCF